VRGAGDAAPLSRPREEHWRQMRHARCSEAVCCALAQRGEQCQSWELLMRSEHVVADSCSLDNSTEGNLTPYPHKLDCRCTEQQGFCFLPLKYVLHKTLKCGDAEGLKRSWHSSGPSWVFACKRSAVQFAVQRAHEMVRCQLHSVCRALVLNARHTERSWQHTAS
jgi:hypothetical protein